MQTGADRGCVQLFVSSVLSCCVSAQLVWERPKELRKIDRNFYLSEFFLPCTLLHILSSVGFKHEVSDRLGVTVLLN